MCLLCDDERNYQAYMDFLDAQRAAGAQSDPDKAMDALLDHLEAQDRARLAPSPENDKTLSPFFCSPINK